MTPEIATPARTDHYLGLLSKLGPILLSAAMGYGAVQFAQGQTQTRIKQLEDHTKGLADARELDIQRFVTRDEFKLFIDATRDDLREIKTDVRAIRSDLKGK